MKPALQQFTLWAAIAALAAQPCAAQLPLVERPHGPFGWRSYQGAYVGPARFTNTNRIYSLMRAGNLYLTVQDALALAIENNLDLEIARYTLPSADWAIERAQAGGPIRGVSGGAPQVGSSDAGIGVLGAISAAGLGGGGGGGAGGVGGGNASVQQIGPVVVNFDPSLTGTNTFSHLTTPFANLAAAGVNPVVDSDAISTTQLQQSFSSGGSVTVRNYYYRQRENSPYDTFNPVLGPNTRIQYQPAAAARFRLGAQLPHHSRRAEQRRRRAPEFPRPVDFRGRQHAQSLLGAGERQR